MLDLHTLYMRVRRIDLCHLSWLRYARQMRRITGSTTAPDTTRNAFIWTFKLQKSCNSASNTTDSRHEITGSSHPPQQIPDMQLCLFCKTLTWSKEWILKKRISSKTPICRGQVFCFKVLASNVQALGNPEVREQVQVICYSPQNTHRLPRLQNKNQITACFATLLSRYNCPQLGIAVRNSIRLRTIEKSM